MPSLIANSNDVLKKISIKVNTIKRYTKDISYYQKELTGQVQKHQLLSSAPDACPHVISKQLEVIKETEAMIPDCSERLERARADLKEYLEQNPVEDSSSEIFIEAQRMIEIS